MDQVPMQEVVKQAPACYTVVVVNIGGGGGERGINEKVGQAHFFINRR